VINRALNTLAVAAIAAVGGLVRGMLLIERRRQRH